MPVEFNCEHCNMLLSADVAPGGEVTCPHCQNVTVVPEGLASLPSPQVPGAETTQAPLEPAPPAPDEAGGDEEMLEEEELPEESKRFMHVLALGMPWLISLFFHVAILLILSLVVMYSILEKAKGSEQAKSVETPQEREIYTDTMETVETTPSNRPTTEREFSPQERPSLDTSATSDIIRPIAMLAEGGPGGFGDPGLGGSGGGGGGMYGSPAPGARNVIYVIDRSGSMQKAFGLVRKEMLDSISNLSEEQDFHVILFATGRPFEKEPARLTAATDEFKGNAATFLEGVEAEGATDPIPALERAFELLGRARKDRPGKLIHLLTDGNFPDNQATLERIKELNKKAGGSVHINTFLYGRRPVEAERIMKLIAEENRGVYKYVSPDEGY